MRLSDEQIENKYFAWLDENCECDIEDNGCTCLNIDGWWKDYLQDLAESSIA
jgi:hypothetical protein